MYMYISDIDSFLSHPGRERTREMSLDDALSQVGEFGRYQKLVIIAIFVSCTITGNVTLLGFFAETEPTSWTCVGAAPPPQSPALSPDDVACRQWENGTCEIGYTLKRDTVVNEVSLWPCDDSSRNFTP